MDLYRTVEIFNEYGSLTIKESLDSDEKEVIDIVVGGSVFSINKEEVPDLISILEGFLTR